MLGQLAAGPEAADAASILLVRGGVAVVNGQRQVGRRRLAAAHELGHYLFADDYTVDWRIGEQDDEEVISRLTTVRGIGRWTSEMFLMFVLNRPDVLPVDDLGLREAAKRFYGLSDRPQAAELTQLAEPWRPYRSIATWYLWRGLDQL